MIHGLPKFVSSVVLATAMMVATPAASHEYEELAPLDEATRAFLITLLEDAGSVNRLDGDPDTLTKAGQALAARMVAVIESADAQDMEWLATADYPELQHPVLGRIPPGIILQFLSDLAGEVAHAETHADEDDHVAPSFKADLKRLKALSEQVWGQ